MSKLITIPPVVDPLGRYWNQPLNKDILIDTDVAMVSSATCKQLAEYSTSIPTGKYAGKMWKAQIGKIWFLRWYEDDPNDATRLFIHIKPIILVD